MFEPGMDGILSRSIFHNLRATCYHYECKKLCTTWHYNQTCSLVAKQIKDTMVWSINITDSLFHNFIYFICIICIIKSTLSTLAMYQIKTTKRVNEDSVQWHFGHIYWLHRLNMLVIPVEVFRDLKGPFQYILKAVVLVVHTLCGFEIIWLVGRSATFSSYRSHQPIASLEGFDNCIEYIYRTLPILPYRPESSPSTNAKYFLCQFP